MDTAWFREDGPVARTQQAWFKHVGRGGNIRTAEGLPVSLTKKMAHLFLQAPAALTIEEALRWAQVVGQGGPESMAQALFATRLGTTFEHEEFWSTVIHFFVSNAMLDPDYAGPIVDYIHHQKYVPQEIVHPGGRVERRDPPQPHFSMKSRSIARLLEQVDRWHAQLAKETRLPAGHWPASGIGEFDEEEVLDDGRKIRWAIRELLSARELVVEGRLMNHCVATYAQNCQSGKTSVWSLRLEDGRGGDYRVMTIAVDNRTRRITEARGRYNARPNASFERTARQRELAQGYRGDLRDSRHYLHRWVDQERLLVSRYR
jgi:hypothetical protein